MRTPRTVLFAACLLLACPAVAAQASVKFFGSGSTTHAPTLTVKGLPRLGTTVEVGATYNSPPPPCLFVLTWYDIALVTGLSNQNWNGVPLPFPLSSDCNLLVSGEVILWQAIQSRTSCPPRVGNDLPHTFKLNVPNQPILIGLRAYQQIVMVLRGRPFCFSTNGVEMTIGL